MPRIIYLGNPQEKTFQNYPNAAPIQTNPSTFNPMDRSTWTPQVLPYRYSWFHVSETAATILQDTLTNAGKTINDVVNQAEQTILQQAPTLIVNAGLQQSVTLTVVGVAVDVGYEQVTEYQVIPGYHAPIPKTAYKIWYALYLIYDTSSSLPVASIPTGTLDSAVQLSFIATIVYIIAIVVAGIVAGILGAIALMALENWLKSMTTTTDTTTLEDTFTNNSDQPQVFTLPDGTKVTVPPHSSATYKQTSTSTTPNLGGILTVGAVGIGLVAVGVFSYAFLKGIQKPKYPPPPPYR